MKFFRDDEERKAYISMMNDINSRRLRIFAPFMLLIMLYEFLDNVSLLLGFNKEDVLYYNFFSRIWTSSEIFTIISGFTIAVSIAAMVINFIFRKNRERLSEFFYHAISAYCILLIILVCAETMIDTAVYHSADFTFFYFIAIVTTTIFYASQSVVIPLILLEQFMMWILIRQWNLAPEFFPYEPYCIFVLVALCFSSLFRCSNLMKTMRHEKRIEELQERAEKENELKSLFLANMSHEIRTPMNAIVGMSELALDFNLDDGEKNTLRQIRSSSMNLVNIINDILDFSKIESGKMDIVPVEYELFKMACDTANVAKVKLAGKSIDFRIEIDPTLSAKYFGDDQRLRQILINLLGNAAKFTENGFVILRIERVVSKVSGTSEIASGEGEEILRFSIIDSGVGIKEEDIGKLFNAFQQVDMKMNRTKGGTGLGLSISKRLVQLMGGKIDLKSIFGKGSCFYFEVPQKIAGEKNLALAYEPVFSASEKNPYHPELRNIPVELLEKKEFAFLFAEKTQAIDFVCPKARILVVDDNDVNLQVAQGLLSKFKVSAKICTSGFEALEVMEKEDFDLVFMDHQMPVMDGIETLGKIRKREEAEGKRTAIVALSANAVAMAKEMFEKSGFDDFLSKPVQKKDFARCLKKWLKSELLETVEAEDPGEKAKVFESEKSFGNENESEDGISRLKKDKEFSEKIDIDFAVNLCGDEDNWKKAAKTFAFGISMNWEKIQKAFDENDIKDWTIYVHALKSSAKMIGALKLSEMAKALEEKGNALQKEQNGEALKVVSTSSTTANTGSTTGNTSSITAESDSTTAISAKDTAVDEFLKKENDELLELYRSYEKLLKNGLEALKVVSTGSTTANTSSNNANTGSNNAAAGSGNTIAGSSRAVEGNENGSGAVSLLKEMKEGAKQNDLSRCEKIFGKLEKLSKENALPAGVAEMLTELEAAVENIEFEQIISILEKIESGF